MTTDQHKPRFEPPPWEKEAFERFHAERNAARSEAELDSVLKTIREQPTATRESGQPEATAMVSGIQLPEVNPSASQEQPSADAAPVIPDARIEAMLVQLRNEEGADIGPKTKVVDVTIGLMALGGIALSIQAFRLFIQTGSNGVQGSGLMFAAVVSMAIFLTGTGFLGGAYMLFRKYHR